MWAMPSAARHRFLTTTLGVAFALGLCAAGCAGRSVMVTDRTPGREVSQAADTFFFWAEGLEYAMTFRHERGPDRYSVVISSRVDQGREVEQQPHSIEFVVDRHRVRVERWSRLEQAPSTVTGPFTCVGVIAKRCGREHATVEHYVWTYLLPDTAPPLFASMDGGTAVLAVRDVAITLELARESQRLREFFSATSSGTAY
jgi:hypothetical protein